MSTALQNGAAQQIDTLQAESGHHIHHTRGDVGGKYYDQKVTNGLSIGEEHFKAAENARRDAKLSSVQDGEPVLIVVMGVSGCGKSTLGAALAHAFEIPFVDADSLHPQSNVDKMSSGIPLTDADRQPWLERIRAEAMRAIKEQSQTSDTRGSKASRVKGLVVGCSALKQCYRDVLRGYSEGQHASPSAFATYFVYIRGSREALMKRMENRKGHFMKSGMLDSQIQTLEPPEATGEPNVITVDLEQSVDEQIGQTKEGFAKLGLTVPCERFMPSNTIQHATHDIKDVSRQTVRSSRHESLEWKGRLLLVLCQFTRLLPRRLLQMLIRRSRSLTRPPVSSEQNRPLWLPTLSCLDVR